MQTFLPYPDFARSAAALDRQRLGKQRVEGLQILNALVLGGGWQNHPAVRMWRGHEAALREYVRAVCYEWRNRGYKDTVLGKVAVFDLDSVITMPEWLGDEEFHLSHRSNLVRKLPDHYRVWFPDVPDDLPYVWPVPAGADAHARVASD